MSIIQGGSIPVKSSSFPSGAKKGNLIYNTTLEEIFMCIDESGDTTLRDHWEVVSKKTTATAVTATTSGVVLDAIDENLGRIIKWIVAITDATNSKYRGSEILAIHNVGAEHQEYAIVGDNIDISLTVEFNSPNMELKIANNITNSISVTILRMIMQ